MVFGWKLLGALRQEKASWEIYTNNNKGMEKRQCTARERLFIQREAPWTKGSVPAAQSSSHSCVHHTCTW